MTGGSGDHLQSGQGSRGVFSGTLLNLRHPSSAALTCSVALGKVPASLNLGPGHKVGTIVVPTSLCYQDS